jgi:aminoglycoside 3-N-acetyltransferase
MWAKRNDAKIRYLVRQSDIQQELRVLGIDGRPVCLHSSLRSLGFIEGGAEAVVRAFLDEGCTLLVPSFSWSFAVPPPPHLQFERNGWHYDSVSDAGSVAGPVYTLASVEIAREMGAIPAAVVNRSDRVRGDHPLNSFAAVGPLADDIVSGQAPLNVYAPLSSLAEMDGFVLLMGVGLEKMTLLHLAEKTAGRNLFRRWANVSPGHAIAVEAGGCSDGFGKLGPALRPVMRTIDAGQGEWTLLPARQTLSAAADAIRREPEITHCSNPNCERCNDALIGGPLL